MNLEVVNFSKSERELIRKSFDEKTLINFRNVFFGEINDDLKKFNTPVMMSILRKIFIPSYRIDGPLFNNVDFLQNVEPVGFETKTLNNVAKAFTKTKELIENSFKRLEGQAFGELPNILVTLGSDENRNAEIIFNRFFLIKTIEKGLESLYHIASSKEEGEEEKKTRIKKDSAM
jgi:hypothetical protein